MEPRPNYSVWFRDAVSKTGFIPHGEPCVDNPCLFDVLNDPTETTNLYLNHPNVVQNMMTKLVLASQGNREPAPDLGKEKQECKIIDKKGAVLPWIDAKGADSVEDIRPAAMTGNEK